MFRVGSDVLPVDSSGVFVTRPSYRHHKFPLEVTSLTFGPGTFLLRKVLPNLLVGVSTLRGSLIPGTEGLRHRNDYIMS